MADIVIDTHVVIWYFTDLTQISQTAMQVLDAAELVGHIYVSSITLVELIYLTEKGKVALDVLTLLRESLDDPATAFRLVEVTREIADEVANIPRPIVPDMPDRIITATALHLRLPLVTKDSKIRALPNIPIIW